MLAPLLLTTLACTGGEEPVTEVPVHDLQITLVNPTNRDPFSGVDGLRLELWVDDEVLASDTFDVGGSPELPELSTFGAVRFHLAGLAGEEVVAYGRTAEIVVIPEQDRVVPMTFLPVNEVLPLLDGMAQERSEHLAVSLPGGRVLIAGGRSPDARDAYDDVEVYDPDSGTFSPLGAYLPTAAYGVEWAWNFGAQEELLFSGGWRPGPAGPAAIGNTGVFTPVDERIDALDDMNWPRAMHCFTMFRPGFGIALGSAGAEATSMDYLQINHEVGEWNWTQLYLTDAAEEDITGCQVTEDSLVFVQGKGPESTGLFDYSDGAQSTSPSVQDAFYPVDPAAAGEVVYAEGAMFAPLSSGDVWVAGGIDVQTARPSSTGQDFDVASLTFINGVDPSVDRVAGVVAPWIEEDWFALGCGSPDTDGSRSQTRLELVDLAGGDRLEDVELDRSRPGCRVNALDDGTILITGGYAQNDGGEESAAVMVPYLQPASF